MKSYCKFTVFSKFQLFNCSPSYYGKLKHAKVRDKRVMKLRVQLPQLPTRGPSCSHLRSYLLDQSEAIIASGITSVGTNIS